MMSDYTVKQFGVGVTIDLKYAGMLNQIVYKVNVYGLIDRFK